MAKKVAVIDIGSNSIKLIIYEKTSRFAFHILHEARSKVKLSENSYKQNANLQEVPMQRTIDALENFLEVISYFKVRKTLCIATSCLRDAPNKKDFTQRVKKELKLNIKIIDGAKEALYSGIACANLLPNQENSLCIDIGGGSTEFSLINNQNISKSISIDIGTMRIKELFLLDKDIKSANIYIDKELEKLGEINTKCIIGIGGTFRALFISLMKTSNYPFDKLHAFESISENLLKIVDLILNLDDKGLKSLYIKNSRLDTIRPGALIVQRILKKLKPKRVIASSVGIREGAYLSDMLRSSRLRFPSNYNTSLRYILDTYVDDKFSAQLSNLCKKIFECTREYLDIDKNYKKELVISAKLYPVGNNIHLYSRSKQGYSIIKNTLEYGFTHNQIMLIATLNKSVSDKKVSQEHFKKYKNLLPDERVLEYLRYIFSLGVALLSHRPRNADYEFELIDKSLHIKSKQNIYLVREAVNKLQSLNNLNLSFKTSDLK